MNKQNKILDLEDFINTYDYKIPSIPYGDWNDLFRFVNGSQEYLDAPAERFYYLNLGYTLLGKIIEIISGLSLSEFIKKEILIPMEMERSSLSLGELEKDNIAVPYISPKGKLTAVEYDDYDFVKAAGGLMSSVLDMANYGMMLLGKGQYGDKIIITEKSIEEITKIQFGEKVHVIEKDYRNMVKLILFGPPIFGYCLC